MGKSGKTLLAVVAGAAAGAIAGVLLAPEKGEKTRKNVVKGLKSGKDDISCKLDDLKNQITSLVSSKKADLSEAIDKLVSKADDKGDDVIAALEAKIKDLKEGAKKVADKVEDKAAEAKNKLK